MAPPGRRALPPVQLRPLPERRLAQLLVQPEQPLVLPLEPPGRPLVLRRALLPRLPEQRQVQLLLLPAPLPGQPEQQTVPPEVRATAQAAVAQRGARHQETPDRLDQGLAATPQARPRHLRQATPRRPPRRRNPADRKRPAGRRPASGVSRSTG